MSVRVRPHPQGGWTHAVQQGAGTVAVYDGWWRSRRAAERALGVTR